MTTNSIEFSFKPPNDLNKGNQDISNLTKLESCKISWNRDSEFNFLSTIPAVSVKYYGLLKEQQMNEIQEYITKVLKEYLGG